MKDELETEIQTALQPAPMDEALVRRLRTMAHETQALGTQSRPLWWQPRFSVPVTMAAGVAAVIAATTLLPAKASAKTFELIEAAAQKVNAFQFSILNNEDGKKAAFTIAGADGKVYMRTDEKSFMEFEPGSMSIYNPGEQKVMRFKYGNLVDAEAIAKEVQSGIADGLKDMDLKKMLAEYRQKYGENGVKISGITQEGGQKVFHVTLASPGQPERIEMTVDADSNLPNHLQVLSADGNRNWHPSVTMEMRFGSRVDASLLRSSIPKDAKVEEIDLGSLVGGAMKGFEDFGKDIEKSFPKK